MKYTNNVFFTKYYWGTEIKEDGMGRRFALVGDVRNAHRI
jgi:hypothetical protein